MLESDIRCATCGEFEDECACEPMTTHDIPDDTPKAVLAAALHAMALGCFWPENSMPYAQICKADHLALNPHNQQSTALLAALDGLDHV